MKTCSRILHIISITIFISIFLLNVTPVAAITITATGNIDSWAFAPGSTSQNSDTVKLTVTSDKTNWRVSVKDALDGGAKSSSTAGRMLEYSSTTGWINTGSVLAGNMIVTGESVTNIQGGNVTLSAGEQDIETGSAAVTNQQLAITLRQPVALTDLRLTNGNAYRIVITFIGVES